MKTEQNPEMLLPAPEKLEELAVEISFQRGEDELFAASIPFETWRELPLRDRMVLVFVNHGNEGVAATDIHGTLKREMLTTESSESLRTNLQFLWGNELLDREMSEENKGAVTRLQANDKAKEFAAETLTSLGLASSRE